jgi:pyruvyltransferase
MSKKTVKAYWMTFAANIANVGDALTPWLCEKYGYTAVRGGVNESLFGAGSIVEMARPGATVFGSGAFGAWRPVAGVNVRALRGPLTGAAPLYGDLGLLVARCVDPATGGGGVKFINHHLTPDASVRLPDGVTLLSTHAPVDEFIAGLRAADAVVSASLHGCVMADALGVPNAACLSGPYLAQNPKYAFRFRDYYAGLGADGVICRTLAEAAANTTTRAVAEVVAALDTEFGKVLAELAR